MRALGTPSGPAIAPAVLLLTLLSGCANPSLNPTGPGTPDEPWATAHDLVSLPDSAGNLVLRTAPDLGTSELAQSDYGIVEVRQERGAVLLRVSDRGERPAQVGSLLLAGAFATNAEPPPSPSVSGGWIFARVLAPGSEGLATGTIDQLVGGNVLVSVNESVFSGVLHMRIVDATTPASVAGLDAKDLFVLVAFQRPTGTSSLLLALGWTDRYRGQVDFSLAQEDLRGRDARVLRVLGSSNQSSLTFYSINANWNLMRVPPSASLNVLAEDSSVVHDENVGVFLSRDLSLRPETVEARGGWGEAFYDAETAAAEGNWCYRFPQGGMPKEGCGVFADSDQGGLNTPVIFATTPIVSWDLESGVQTTTPSQVGPEAATFWILSTDLDVGSLTGLSLADYFFSNHKYP